jgi:hypothetical protein
LIFYFVVYLFFFVFKIDFHISDSWDPYCLFQTIIYICCGRRWDMIHRFVLHNVEYMIIPSTYFRPSYSELLPSLVNTLVLVPLVLPRWPLIDITPPCLTSSSVITKPLSAYSHAFSGHRNMVRWTQ